MPLQSSVFDKYHCKLRIKKNATGLRISHVLDKNALVLYLLVSLVAAMAMVLKSGRQGKKEKLNGGHLSCWFMGVGASPPLPNT